MPVPATYLDWLTAQTPTRWWHDSADPAEVRTALGRGAIGVTTNPVLASTAVRNNRDVWGVAIDRVLARKLEPEQKAEALMQIAVTDAAEKLLPTFEASDGSAGFVCAQVNPARAAERASMAGMAKRFRGWAPNIAVKLPATAAGLDVLEDCAAEGITTTATVSFTVAQTIAIAERHRAGVRRARQTGIDAGKCFAVIMIGRLDDYLREVARDAQVGVSEADICQAGLAVSKRAYDIYRERRYEAVLLVAALRGSYHLTELAGAELLMSIHPAYQPSFTACNLPHETRIDCPIDCDVIERLSAMPDFVRAYEPGGMEPHEFMSFGLTQRTLGQFVESWKQLETLQ